MKLHELLPSGGARKRRRRVGRGLGSGRGTTAGRGSKGQKARSGGKVPPYFEGGQLPLVRRLPYRRGFVNPFRKEFHIVNVCDLQRFEAGAIVDREALIGAGLVPRAARLVKVLGGGQMTKLLNVRVDRFSRQAKERIEAAGGTAEEVGSTSE